MVRLPLACALAVVLALAGGAVEYDAITRSSPLKFAVGVIAKTLGIAWLYLILKEWFGSPSSKS
jgi:hypothetical protein